VELLSLVVSDSLEQKDGKTKTITKFQTFSIEPVFLFILFSISLPRWWDLIETTAKSRTKLQLINSPSLSLSFYFDIRNLTFSGVGRVVILTTGIDEIFFLREIN